MQRVEVDDFSGGVTDYYLNAPANKMKVCDNLLIIQYPGIGKPFTRPGCQLFSSAAPQIPAGAQRISTSFYYKDIFHVQSSQKLYYFSAGSWIDILGPTGNNAFVSADTSKYFTYASWNYHTLMAHSGRQHPQKVVISALGVPEVFEAGLPRFDASTTTFTPAAGANDWLYKLVYKQTYVTKDNITFVDYGSPSAARAVTGSTTVAITTIPVLSNGVTDNFRTAVIEVEIYRTVNDGTVFYLVGSVTNGTTVFNDTVLDTALVNNRLLYTEGGVAENDRPPKCKIVDILQDTAYFSNIEDSTGQILNYRCQQSVPGDIDSAPAEFFVDVDDEIVGQGSTKSNELLLCRKLTYRIDGQYDSLGRGGMTVERISDTAGCVSAQSVVKAIDGVFWAGLDGIYFSDGFQVTKLNQDYDKTWKTFVTNGGVPDDTRCSRIQGKYDQKKNRIIWTIQSPSGSDVDSCYVLDLNWGVRQNATFTTMSGGASFAPTSIECYNGELIRCDKRGYVLIHKDTLHSDIKIDVGVTPVDWVKQTIIYSLESISYNFGTSFSRKYVTGIFVTCESTTNLSLQLISNNDDDKSILPLAPIRYRGTLTWGDEDVYWGDPALNWNQSGLIHEKRKMPQKSLRCNYKSIKFTNSKVAIISSDTIGTADVNAAAKTVTLSNTVSYDWPTNSIDYYISFEDDGYVNEYLVTARTNDVLTYQDLNGYSHTMIGEKWVLRGYPKDEVLNLLNYSINYELFGMTQHAFQNSESGEVGS